MQRRPLGDRSNKGAIVSQSDIEDLQQRAMPLVGNCPGVYLLFRGNRVVYVGQSWNCLLGVAEQTRNEKPKSFDRWTFIREPDPEARRARVKAEKSKHAPEYNKH
jgi:hypothetical protein